MTRRTPALFALVALVAPSGLGLGLGCAGSSPRSSSPSATGPEAGASTDPGEAPSPDDEPRSAELLTAEEEVSVDDDRRPGAVLQAQLAEVEASGARVGAGSAPRAEGPAAGRAAATLELDVRHGPEDTSLAAYASGLVRCFVDELAAGGPDGARLTVTLAVDGLGRSAPPPREPDGPLEACVASRMASWRFEPPRDEDGEPTDATFELSLGFARGPGPSGAGAR